MANNQEMYCRHCKEMTLFFLESDLLWHCDECGNVYDSIPDDEIEEMEDGYFDDYDVGEVIKCPCCNNLIEMDDLEDGYLCPVCFEDLSDIVEDSDEE